jgi:hypothetical protein
MAYADYDYYRNVYRGKAIAADNFSRLSAHASAFLDCISAAADRPDSDTVKMAACAVAEAWQRNEEGEVVSESVGGWSKTYATGPSKTKGQALIDAARVYLGPAGLMRVVGWV